MEAHLCTRIESIWNRPGIHVFNPVTMVSQPHVNLSGRRFGVEPLPQTAPRMDDTHTRPLLDAPYNFMTALPDIAVTQRFGKIRGIIYSLVQVTRAIHQPVPPTKVF